jgi:hypothetical protein
MTPLEPNASGPDEDATGIDPDTVEALVDTVRNLLRDEDNREQGFNARAVGISGFSGLILSLAGPASAASTGTRALGVQWKYAVLALLGLSLLALLGTVATSVVGVLIPKEYATIAMSEVARYPLPEFVRRRRVMVQGSTLRGLVDALASERKKNSAKSRALGWAYRQLLAGLLGVTTLAVILGLHAVGSI